MYTRPQSKELFLKGNQDYEKSLLMATPPQSKITFKQKLEKSIREAVTKKYHKNDETIITYLLKLLSGQENQSDQVRSSDSTLHTSTNLRLSDSNMSHSAHTSPNGKIQQSDNMND